MADLEFNRDDVVSLIRKLSTLESIFSEQERALLLAIFAAAADRAKQTSPSEATLPGASVDQAPGTGAGTDEQPTLADLQQQLLSAYTPGNSFDSVTQPPVPPSIHHIPPPPPPPPPPPLLRRRRLPRRLKMTGDPEYRFPFVPESVMANGRIAVRLVNDLPNQSNV